MKLNKIYITLGLICIIVGLFFAFKPFVENAISSQQQKQTVRDYKAQQSDDDDKTTPKIPEDKSKVAGTIEIDSVNIKAPVYPGEATPSQLKRGISFAEEDEDLDSQNISIAGHTSNVNSKYQFTPLNKVSTGDEVKFTVGNEVRVYKMTDIKNVPPDKVEVMDEHKNEKDQITLITCDNYNEQTGVWEDRKIYVAKLIDTHK